MPSRFVPFAHSLSLFVNCFVLVVQGKAVIEKNIESVRRALDALVKIDYPKVLTDHLSWLLFLVLTSRQLLIRNGQPLSQSH